LEAPAESGQRRTRRTTLIDNRFERDRKLCEANSMILVPFGGQMRVQT
jgi:hypothetical protein